MTTTAFEISAARPQGKLNCLLIGLAGELYALSTADVREIVRWRALTPVPGAPPVMPGIISQRGAVLPVVDLRLALELTAGPADRATRFVVASHAGVDMALVVDVVLDLADFEAGAFEALADGAQGRMVRGVARHEGRPVALIDLGALIESLRGQE